LSGTMSCMKGGYQKALAICFLAFAIIIGFGVLQFDRATATAAQAASPVPALKFTETSSTSSESVAVAPPTGYLPYSNPQFHFSVDYPSNLQMHTYQEPGGGFTAAFQDPTDNVGFEVYVTPYSGTQITEDRFRIDEPSGVIDQRTTVTIDGVPATAFYGSNTIMGDTREVWFIKGGLLYEVTTYKQLDTLLAQIMQTWTFI
jgi:hypothetical protein